MKFAVIDVGSNSVRLMLWADGTTLYKRVCITRLGEGIDGGCLSEPSMLRTADAISSFSAEAKGEGAKTFCFATAAVRSAKNGGEFCARVKEACGLDVDVVSGEEEATLAALGASADRDGAVLDIGGASTEYLVKKGGKTVFSVSLPIGCVRLFDRCGDRGSELSVEIGKALVGSLPAPCGDLFLVGGTAATLASVRLGLSGYDAAKLQGLRLPVRWVNETAHSLLQMTAEERRNVRGMDPRRADIIAGGALLLYEIMRKIGADEAFFSDRDNLEGYLCLRGLV